MSGKIAVVTGSGSGIGRASALALLNNGYKVALAGRRKDALDETVKLAGNNTPNAMAVPTDVTKKDDIVALFAKVKATWGRIDIGNAVTPMTERMTKGVLQPNGTTVAEPRMDVSAVANAIVYMDSLPLDANVQFMTVMATKMPFVGRG